MGETIELTIQIPSLKPNALPWGRQKYVNLTAIISCAALPVLSIGQPDGVQLPSTLEFEINFSECAQQETESRDAVDTSLVVEVMGCDHGVSFPLGNASVDLPFARSLRPGLGQSMSRSASFRAPLIDNEGALVGTVGGNFVVKRRKEVPIELNKGIVNSNFPESLRLQLQSDHLPQEQEYCVKQDAALSLLDMATNLFQSSANIQENEEITEQGESRFNASQHVSADVPCEGDTDGPGEVEDKVGEHSQTDTTIRRPIDGFRFEPRAAVMSWGQLVSANVGRIERDGDVHALMSFMVDIAVGQLDSDAVDAHPGLITAFQMIQLSTQYLLYSQQILRQQSHSLDRNLKSMELGVEGIMQGRKVLRERVHLLRREASKQDKIIGEYASLLRRHNPGLAARVYLDDGKILRVLKQEDHDVRTFRPQILQRNRVTKPRHTEFIHEAEESTPAENFPPSTTSSSRPFSGGQCASPVSQTQEHDTPVSSTGRNLCVETTSVASCSPLVTPQDPGHVNPGEVSEASNKQELELPLSPSTGGENNEINPTRHLAFTVETNSPSQGKFEQKPSAPAETKVSSELLSVSSLGVGQQVHGGVAGKKKRVPRLVSVVSKKKLKEPLTPNDIATGPDTELPQSALDKHSNNDRSAAGHPLLMDRSLLGSEALQSPRSGMRIGKGILEAVSSACEDRNKPQDNLVVDPSTLGLDDCGNEASDASFLGDFASLQDISDGDISSINGDNELGNC